MDIVKDLTTSLLSVGLQQSKALCQMRGESLEVLKSEQPTQSTEVKRLAQGQSAG